MKKFSQMIRMAFTLCLLCGMVFCGASCGKKDDAAAAAEKAVAAAKKMTKLEILVDAGKNAIQNKDWATLMAIAMNPKDLLSEEDRAKLDNEMEALEPSFTPEMKAEMKAAMAAPNFEEDCDKALKALLDKLANATDAVPGELDALKK